jgi:hypothetical protein
METLLQADVETLLHGDVETLLQLLPQSLSFTFRPINLLLYNLAPNTTFFGSDVITK